MKLSETWFMEGYIDFELQKYRLLAYLKEVRRHFDETKLYPQLADIIFHYNNLTSFRDNKKILHDQFPKTLDHIDRQKMELVYDQLMQDSEVIQELDRIIAFATEQMKNTIDNGTEIYELVEKQLRIEPVGIIPLYKSEGYILLQYGNYSEIRAYSYTITLFEQKDARFKGIKVNFINSWPRKISNTYEQIKRDIIRNIPALPNPAVYSIESALTVPLDETLLPVAKRMLVRYLA